jgi:chromate transporter
MAVAFIIAAAYRINRKVLTNRLTVLLCLASAVTTYFMRSPWIFPLVLVSGGIVSIRTSGASNLWHTAPLKPPWHFLAAFAAIAAGSLILTLTFDDILIHLFESFYRYGYLVFGGGQVVVPVMFSELVQLKGYLTEEAFLTGYGLVQGLPGPMFSFSAYAGGMAARPYGAATQIAGAFAAGTAIFLPGLLLIFFIFPVWQTLREMKGIKIALTGINAVAGGLIAASAFILMQKTGFTFINLAMMLITVVLLLTKKIPAPLIVIGMIFLGIILP